MVTAARKIKPGDVYWLKSEHRVSHPHVIIQIKPLSQDNTKILVLCALTTNPKKASMPGNVVLDVGEASLSRQSTVEVSKLQIIDSEQLGEYIGSLEPRRLRQVLAGVDFLQKAFLSTG